MQMPWLPPNPNPSTGTDGPAVLVSAVLPLGQHLRRAADSFAFLSPHRLRSCGHRSLPGG